jgi:HD superfamily phosphohydrolase YqeK
MKKYYKGASFAEADANANQTLGRQGMSLLSYIVLLADSLEPGRGDTEEFKLYDK